LIENDQAHRMTSLDATVDLLAGETDLVAADNGDRRSVLEAEKQALNCEVFPLRSS